VAPGVGPEFKHQYYKKIKELKVFLLININKKLLMQDTAPKR
jgi:hypothetical protein